MNVEVDKTGPHGQSERSDIVDRSADYGVLVDVRLNPKVNVLVRHRTHILII